MAIFLASIKSISRGSGQSAVASASYRSGEVLKDERYGKTHDYSKRSGVMSADIILPSALANAKVTIDRGELWNKAEAAEKRKDARVAREWLVNLPHELSEQDRKTLAHKFAQTLADRYGTIADCAIHQPTQKEIDRGADPRNYHAHIMFTTRCAELDENNEITLTDKATIELSDKKRRSLGLERVSEEIKEVRQLWEQIVNDKLTEHDHELIDSRSYAEQGIDITPQLKMGSVATKLERDKYESELEKAEQAKKQGEVYEIDETPATIRGEVNAMIAERNQLVKQQEKDHDTILEYIADNTKRTRTTVQDVARATLSIKYATGQIGDNERGIESRKRHSEYANRLIEHANSEFDEAADSRKRGKSALSHSQSTIDALQRAITDGERETQSVNCHLEHATCECDRTARHSERIKQHLTRPSPFDDNARRARAASRKRAIAELDKQAKLFDNVSYETNYDIEYRKSEIDRINDKSDELTTETVNLFIYRKNNPDFSDRQQEILERWATENELTTADFRDRYRSARAFFDNADTVKNHQNIVRLLRDPQTDENNHSKTLKFDPQSDLNVLTRDNTPNLSQTSNTANDLISVSSRRYKP